MPRKKRKVTEKAKKKPVKKKSPRKKKSKAVKKKQTRLEIFWSIVILMVLASAVFFVFFKKQTDNSPKISSPIRHLIASISAQNQNIKIDPEFSYSQEQLKKESPLRIVIPSVNIDTSIVDAQIIDGFWETATASASFGLGSAYPDEAGNTVIFAHAKEGLFANLRKVEEEAAIYLFTESKWLAYEVKEIKNVLPNQIEVVSPTADRTLTLYTCNGYQDAYRLVVVATPLD